MKNQFKNKRAFTLIELLIVIAIIGILFIVLVSKVDFATDKAKASGVQTDFRSFQVALDTVAQENAGFNTFGFNTGDNAGAIPAGYAFVDENAKNATIGDGIRNSYDEGDKNLDGKSDGEVWTGRKIYTETWTEVYTLVKPGTTGLDANAVFALETAINKNLDPKLHITINADGKITMANQARDPWKNEYHGVYISQAERDNGADRGAIIMYSNGANGKWGSAHDITNGVVTVTVPGNNVNGKDDYSIVSCYTFTNGYGEVLNMSTGFSNNQSFNGNTTNTPAVVPGGNGGNNGGGNQPSPIYPTASEGLSFDLKVDGTYELSGIGECTDIDIVIPAEVNGKAVTSIASAAFGDQGSPITSVVIPGSVKEIGTDAFFCCDYLENVTMYNGVITIGSYAFGLCPALTNVTIPDSVTSIGNWAFYECTSLTSVVIPDSVTSIGKGAFQYCSSLPSVVIPDGVISIGDYAFEGCSFLTNVVISESVTSIGVDVFYGCYGLEEITVSENNKNYKSIDGNLYTKDGITLIHYAPFKIDTSFTIPNSVVIISEWAFEDCDSLENVTIPDSVTTISKGMFYDCNSLTSVVIGNGVTNICDYAFWNCDGLASISFNGTIAQWNAITKGYRWNDKICATEVICSDGTVALN